MSFRNIISAQKAKRKVKDRVLELQVFSIVCFYQCNKILKKCHFLDESERGK